jgi:hypothetical protein
VASAYTKRGWHPPQATQSACAAHLDVSPQRLACLCSLLFLLDAPRAYPYLTPNRAGLSSSGVCPSGISSHITSSRYPVYYDFQTASILLSTRLFRPLVLPCVVNQTRLYGSYGCRGTRPALPPRDGSTKGFVGEREVGEPVDCRLWHRRRGLRVGMSAGLRLLGGADDGDRAGRSKSLLFCCIVFVCCRLLRGWVGVSWLSSAWSRRGSWPAPRTGGLPLLAILID